MLGSVFIEEIPGFELFIADLQNYKVIKLKAFHGTFLSVELCF